MTAPTCAVVKSPKPACTKTSIALGSSLLLISGQFGVAPDLVVSPEFADQLEQAMANIEALLRSASMDTTNMVKVTYYLTRTGDLPVLGQIRRQRWASSEPPAVTVLVVSALARPDCLVEVEVVAVAE